MPQLAYKLVSKKRDRSLGSLFINRKARFPFNQWLEAECFPTKGFAVRPGFHCTLVPVAPHLSTEGRVWIEVLVEDFRYFDRPESQGGTWVLANRMMVLRELV